MTKKNVAALMLAGAMMTVGSGAMAATGTQKEVTGTSDTVEVAVTYSTADAINVTVSWNELDKFVYTWNGSAWEINGGQKDGGNITFNALNKGFSDRNVSVKPSNTEAIDWLTVNLVKSDGGGRALQIRTIQQNYPDKRSKRRQLPYIK